MVIVREAENKKRLHAGLPEKEGFFLWHDLRNNGLFRGNDLYQFSGSSVSSHPERRFFRPPMPFKTEASVLRE